jgi:hypothetical protein
MTDFAQRHNDKIILLKLAAAYPPTSYDKVMLGALMMRYKDNPEMNEDVELVIRAYRLTPKELFLQCREIWASGFRPEDLASSGSSWDSTTNEAN